MILVLLEVKRIVRLAGKDDEGGDDDLEVVMMVVLMVVIGFQRLVSRSPPFLPCKRRKSFHNKHFQKSCLRSCT